MTPVSTEMREREDEHRRVDADLPGARGEAADERRQHIQRQPGEADAEDAAGHGDEDALGDQLPQQSDPDRRRARCAAPARAAAAIVRASDRLATLAQAIISTRMVVPPSASSIGRALDDELILKRRRLHGEAFEPCVVAREVLFKRAAERVQPPPRR